MRIICLLLCVLAVSFDATARPPFYEGSTPAHLSVRRFLNISLTDSIDFIKWQLTIDAGTYSLDCRYGLSKAGTEGFTNEKRIGLFGAVSRQGYRYVLKAGQRSLFLFEMNSNLLYILDEKQNMLVGNGGYSYCLNIDKPVITDQLNASAQQSRLKREEVFQGRTPCQELSKMMGLNKSDACDKMKWYIILVVDSITGKPSHYLKGGRAYKRETMTRGSWETSIGKDGRVIYRLDPDKNAHAYLVRIDPNILYFTDADGNLLVGNKNFSYALNKVN